MARFQSLNVNGIDADTINLSPRLRSLARSVVRGATSALDQVAPEEILAQISRVTPESASRMMLQTYLEDAGDLLREITSPQRPERVPDMVLRATVATPGLNASSVSFQQTSGAIPIFGGRVVVDVDADDRTLVAINGKVTPKPDKLSPLPTVSAHDAFEALKTWGAAPDLAPPARAALLNWYLDEDTEDWRLVYHFAQVHMAPPDDDPAPAADPPVRVATCVCHPMREDEDLFDYLVDAHRGTVVFYYAATARIDVPAPMDGEDAKGVLRDFYGLTGAGGFVLSDPLRNIQTFDYGHDDIDAKPQPPLPATPFPHPTSNLGKVAPAAVSAHYHAQLVYDFYNDVLKRDGVDDKGMTLVSVINTYSSYRNPSPRPNWGNAVWYQNRMWYGQDSGVSFAKYLDIIAHELTHGVTETTSNLIYRRLPGALNESFSDIFGVIIANWYPAAPSPVATWNWEIGPGLGQGGGPLRDLSDPPRAGQPDHMSQYVVWPLSRDYGGVHHYSGIHNKAVYNLLTGLDAGGTLTFPTQDAALLLYLTLTRLTPTSDFLDSRRTLENVCTVYYGGNAATRTARLAAIAAAFDSVGVK